jgi:hypothetical protein
MLNDTEATVLQKYQEMLEDDNIKKAKIFMQNILGAQQHRN